VSAAIERVDLRFGEREREREREGGIGGRVKKERGVGPRNGT